MLFSTPVSTGAAASPALAVQRFWNSSFGPLAFDENRTSAPSGDQVAKSSAAAPDVNCVMPPRASITQISELLAAGSKRVTATRVPSGDSDGFTYGPAGVTVEISRPDRSNHRSCDVITPARYASTVPREAENAPWLNCLNSDTLS